MNLNVIKKQVEVRNGVQERRPLAFSRGSNYSPAGMLALLILDHPGFRYKEQINRLGIEWMLQDHAALHVQDGFWAGIQPENLQIFVPPEDRASEVEFLSDYDSLLGEKICPGKVGYTTLFAVLG
ncbi:hypothetical protein CIB48_g819 [Xylaria polymorpha]|nr:hypothetical protein CIB48_g819 [Xylaria polymorpha]